MTTGASRRRYQWSVRPKWRGRRGHLHWTHRRILLRLAETYIIIITTSTTTTNGFVCITRDLLLCQANRILGCLCGKRMLKFVLRGYAPISIARASIRRRWSVPRIRDLRRRCAPVTRAPFCSATPTCSLRWLDWESGMMSVRWKTSRHSLHALVTSQAGLRASELVWKF